MKTSKFATYACCNSRCVLSLLWVPRRYQSEVKASIDGRLTDDYLNPELRSRLPLFFISMFDIAHLSFGYAQVPVRTLHSDAEQVPESKTRSTVSSTTVTG